MPDDAIERARLEATTLRMLLAASGTNLTAEAGCMINRAFASFASFASQQAPEGWERDFSGAPFDGTPILAAFGPATGNRVDIVFWQDGPKPYWRSVIMERVHGIRYMRANQPIVWQHKPAPPADLATLGVPHAG